MKKWTIGLSVVIILAAAGAGAYYFYFAKDKVAAEVMPTSLTVKAAKGSIVKQVTGTGSVAANSRETVTAGKSGTIATVNVKKGDKIKAGQILVTFEAADGNDDKIKSIEKNITKLQESITEYQENYKAATGTENEETLKESLHKSMESANAEIADYEDQLQDIYEEQAKEEKVVSASIDGEITEMAIKVGDEVNSNTTIATIVDYTTLEFVTSVDELDIASLKVNQAADLSLSAITDKKIGATVSEIAMEGTSNNGSSAFEVNIRLKDIEGVKAGMSGEAAVTIASKENIILVPVNAVVEMGTRSFVRVPTANGGGIESAAVEQQRDGAVAPGRGEADQSQDVKAEPGAATSGVQRAPTQEAGSGARVARDVAGGKIGASTGQAGSDRAAAGGGVAAGGRAGGRMPDALGGQLVEVKTGLSDENFVEIVSGLKEGDSVLVPIAQGANGMGSGSTEMTMRQGGFAGDVMVFPGGGMRSNVGGMR